MLHRVLVQVAQPLGHPGRKPGFDYKHQVCPMLPYMHDRELSVITSPLSEPSPAGAFIGELMFNAFELMYDHLLHCGPEHPSEVCGSAEGYTEAWSVCDSGCSRHLCFLLLGNEACYAGTPGS